MYYARLPSPQPRRGKRAALTALIAIVLAATLSPATAVTSPERKLHGMIVRAREAKGVSSLALSSKLSRRAHRHSADMARSGRIFHSCLDCRRGSGSASLGENVGVGGSLDAVHDALMKSSSHRDNILKSAYERVGVGVVKQGGRVWVTEIFSG
ncbi:MAG: CAP domain-containing protein [Actinomycetota bacterium]